jgi:N-methylhydantoinase A
MCSNGGVATPATVAKMPVSTLLSGPAAGVLGGAWSGALSGRDRLITFDVGGTSADIGIVVDGRFAEAAARDTWIGGYPVLAPMIDPSGNSLARPAAGPAPSSAYGPRAPCAPKW